jgi:hypothetical protein
MEDETKEKITKSVLLFSAIIITVIATYTTYNIFSEKNLDISFSPPNTADFSLNKTNDTAWKTSFDMEQKSPADEFDPSAKGKVYKNQPIEPYSGEGLFKNPLIIYNKENIKKEGWLFLVIALEIVVIFGLYRKMHKIASIKQNIPTNKLR